MRLLMMLLLTSCSTAKKQALKTNIEPTILTETAAPTRNFNLPDSFYYCSSGSSPMAKLVIKKQSLAHRKEMPDSLEFELILTGKYPSDKISGVAVLSSNNESFSDPDEVDGGDYFAADYYCKKNSTKIRLDIETYQACVVNINAHSRESYFLKKRSR